MAETAQDPRVQAPIVRPYQHLNSRRSRHLHHSCSPSCSSFCPSACPPHEAPARPISSDNGIIHLLPISHSSFLALRLVPEDHTADNHQHHNSDNMQCIHSFKELLYRFFTIASIFCLVSSVFCSSTFAVTMPESSAFQ